MGLILLLLFLSRDDHTDTKPIEQAWSILQTNVDEKSADKRAKAVRALGLIEKNKRAESMAEKALSDSNADVRAGAATALGAMQATGSKARLENALLDNDVKVVLAAANALYAMKDPAAYEVYYALLTGERKSSNGLVQNQMARFKDRKQVEMLALQTGLGFVPFGGMSYEAWQTIRSNDTSSVRAVAALKLAHDPDPKTGEALAKMRFDKSWQVRLGVVEAIAQRKDPSLQGAVATLMWDDSDAVRFEAAAAVVKLDEVKTSAERDRKKPAARSPGRVHH